MSARFFPLAALAVSAAVVASGPAWAHARLVSSNPAANTTVAATPRTITLTFNEKLVPAFSTFQLTMPDHGMKVAVKTSISKDGKSITGTPRAVLTKGAYRILWTATAADGHKMTGEVAFNVG